MLVLPLNKSKSIYVYNNCTKIALVKYDVLSAKKIVN